jgi:hypothetical protein
MAFMYDSVYGKVEFGTTHGMKPVYKMLNQLFRYTLTPKIGDNTNISNVAKEILVKMAPGKEDFSIFNFILGGNHCVFCVLQQELPICSLDLQDDL